MKCIRLYTNTHPSIYPSPPPTPHTGAGAHAHADGYPKRTVMQLSQAAGDLSPSIKLL